MKSQSGRREKRNSENNKNNSAAAKSSNRPASAASTGFRNSSRKNGWNFPLHPLQFIAWFFLIFFNVIYNAMAVPVLPYHWQPAAYIILGIVVVFHVFTHLVSVTMDPADDATLRKKKKTMPTFDRSRHGHVIVNNYCYLCECMVSVKSKHCSTCNKCVANFDHHCKWLNNCVGSKNYRIFIACLASAFVCCLLVFSVFLYIDIVYWTNPKLLHPDVVAAMWHPVEVIQYPEAMTTPIEMLLLTDATPTQPITDLVTSVVSTTQVPSVDYQQGLCIFSFPVSGTAFFTTSVIITVLLAITLALLGHLLGFHMFLMYRKQSTYEYIINKRDARSRINDVESQRDAVKDAEHTPGCCSKLSCCKCNRVMPSTEDIEMSIQNENKENSTPESTSFIPSTTTATIEQPSNNNSSIKQPLNKQHQDQNHVEPKTTQAVINNTAVRTKDNRDVQLVAVKHKSKKKKRRKPSKYAKSSATEGGPHFHQYTQQQADHHEHPWGQAPYGTMPVHLDRSLPETFLEQHLVRRYSLPTEQMPGMYHAATGEPIPGQMLVPQGYGPPPIASLPRRNAPFAHYNSLPSLGLIPPIQMQPSGPPAEYNSSSAESVDEVPIENSAGGTQGHLLNLADAQGRPLNSPGAQGRHLARGFYPYHHGGHINPAASYPGGPPVVPQYYRYVPTKPMRIPMMRLPLHKKHKKSSKRQAAIKEVSPVTSNMELEDSPIKRDPSKDEINDGATIKDDVKIKNDVKNKNHDQNKEYPYEMSSVKKDHSSRSTVAGSSEDQNQGQSQDNQENAPPEEPEQDRLHRMSRRALSLR